MLTYQALKDDKSLCYNINTLRELRWALALYPKELPCILLVDDKILRKISELNLNKNEYIRKYFNYSLSELDELYKDILYEK